MRTPSPGPERRATPPSPLALLAAVLLAAALLSVPLPEQMDPVGPARAQLLDDCGTLPLPIMECEFALSSLEDLSGPPLAIVNQTLTITNSGDARDAYKIAIEADNATWTVEVDPAETDPVESEGSIDIEINVLVPDDARVGDTTTVSLNVSSQNDDEVFEVVTFDVTATQFYDWILVCDNEVTIRKGQEGTIMLTATNIGNGRDQATLTFPPLPEGIQIDPVEAFVLDAGRLGDRNITIGVGIGLEEGEYVIDWNLESQGDPDVTDQCRTTLTAIIGGNGDDGEEEDSPLPAALVLLVALTSAIVARRARVKAL